MATRTLAPGRRAVLAAAAADPVAAAVPAAVWASGPADPSLAAYAAWRAAADAVNASGLRDDDPVQAELEAREGDLFRAWCATPATTPAGVFHRMRTHFDMHGDLDRVGRVVPTGFSADDRMKHAILRDLAAQAGEPPVRFGRARKVAPAKVEEPVTAETKAVLTDAEREEIAGMWQRVWADLASTTDRVNAIEAAARARAGAA